MENSQIKPFQNQLPLLKREYKKRNSQWNIWWMDEKRTFVRSDLLRLQSDWKTANTFQWKGVNCCQWQTIFWHSKVSWFSYSSRLRKTSRKRTSTCRGFRICNWIYHYVMFRKMSLKPQPISVLLWRTFCVSTFWWRNSSYLGNINDKKAEGHSLLYIIFSHKTKNTRVRCVQHSNFYESD